MNEQSIYAFGRGRVAPFVEARLMDEMGNFLPHDGKTVGEIVVRTPWNTQGYYNDAERGVELWKGGWLHTGDVASISPDYWIVIADRTKDVIKTGGEWGVVLRYGRCTFANRGCGRGRRYWPPRRPVGRTPARTCHTKAGLCANPRKHQSRTTTQSRAGRTPQMVRSRPYPACS